jgi:nucleoside diphosphate kinase
MSDGDNRAVRNVVHASGSVREANDEIKALVQTGRIDEIQDYY